VLKISSAYLLRQCTPTNNQK